MEAAMEAAQAPILMELRDMRVMQLKVKVFMYLPPHYANHYPGLKSVNFQRGNGLHNFEIVPYRAVVNGQQVLQDPTQPPVSTPLNSTIPLLTHFYANSTISVLYVPLTILETSQGKNPEHTMVSIMEWAMNPAMKCAKSGLPLLLGPYHYMFRYGHFVAISYTPFSHKPSITMYLAPSLALSLFPVPCWKLVHCM